MFVTPKMVCRQAIDLKAARASHRVAIPTARRPQPTLKAAIRRGCRVIACITSVEGNQRAPVITLESNSNHLQLKHHLPPSNYLTTGSFLAGSSFSAFFVLSYPVRAHIDLHTRFPIRNSTLTSQYCSPRMSGKLDSSSEKQARDKVQSGCKLSGIRRFPFADITNNLDSRLGRHDEPSFPPLQSHTLNGVAIQKENGSKISDSGKARNCWGAARHSPPMTSYTGFPSPLEGAGSSSPVKSISGVPSVPPLGSVLQSRPSRRQVSLGSGVLNQYEPGLGGESTVNDVLLYEAPNVKPPLPSCPGPSTREPLSTSLLPSKTHKLAGGQLAILPSRSVLVDFREGERRKGRKGEEVIVVSPNGDQVNCSPRYQGT